MTNPLVRATPSSLLSELGLGSDQFADSIFEKMLSFSLPKPDLMRRFREDDGSNVYEFNLAGFTDEEINVHFDTAMHQLVVNAEHEEEGNHRKFSTSVLLSPYSTPDDVAVTYVHGVLKVAIAPVEQRKQEALVSIPLKNEN